MKRSLKKVAHFFDLQNWGALMALSVGVGLCGGLGAVVFQHALHWIQHVTILPALDVPPSWYRSLLILGIPTAGGLIAGILVFSFAPEAEGHGTDAMIRAFHRFHGAIRTRVPVVKTVASAITIGSGGSAGKEGPIAQIGAGIGSLIGRALKLGTQRRRLLVLAGAGAGVGAIFRAPLGGALFSAEVLYREPDFEYEAIVPSIIASITGYAVFTTLCGYGYLFKGVDKLQFHQTRELLLYVLLGVACAVLGYLYVKIFYGSRDHFFRKLPIPVHVRPAIGGFLLGVMALALPEVLDGGYGFVQDVIDNRSAAFGYRFGGSESFHAFEFLLLVALAKMVATGFTISSGGSGGVFGPSLFIGAMIGGSFGYLVQAVAPEMMQETTRESLILVGMGGFFAGVAKVPIASLIMITEMTGSYGLIVPLMLTCTVAFVLSRRWTLYEEQVKTRVDSPAHLGDFAINVLEDIRVREVFSEEHRQFESLRENTSLAEFVVRSRQTFQTFFPVLNDEDRLVGMVSFNDVRQVVSDEVLGSLVVAGDICEIDVLTTSLDENLYQVLRKMAQEDIDVLPVVDTLDETRLLGILSRKDIILAYDRRLRKLKQEAGSPETIQPVDVVPYRSDSVLLEVEVLPKHARLARRFVREVPFPGGCLLVSIQRGGGSIIPNGLTRIEPGDRLLVLTKRDQVPQVKKSLGEP